MPTESLLISFLVYMLIALPWAAIRTSRLGQSFLSAWFTATGFVMLIFISIGSTYAAFTTDNTIYDWMFIIFIILTIIAVARDHQKWHKPSPSRLPNPASPKVKQADDVPKHTLEYLLLAAFILFFIFLIASETSRIHSNNNNAVSYFAPTRTLIQSTMTSNPSRTPTKLSKTQIASMYKTNTADDIDTTSSEESNGIRDLMKGTVTIPTYEPTCTRWNMITTTTHLNTTQCVYGTVKSAWIDKNQNTFFMTFGSLPSDFYMLVYDGWYFEGVENHCVMATGKIMKIGNAPVMVVDPGDLYMCDD